MRRVDKQMTPSHHRSGKSKGTQGTWNDALAADPKGVNLETLERG